MFNGRSRGKGRLELGVHRGQFGGVPLYAVQEDPQALMRQKPPYGYKFQTFRIDELLAKLHNGSMPKKRHFRRCAVVGSSGSLLQHELGAEIDDHDAVIRINSAPASSRFGRFTGVRTTWRVMASPHAASDWRFTEQARFPNETMLVVCDRPYVYSCQNVLFATWKQRMHAVNPLFYQQVRKHTGKSVIPLTGVVAVAIAMRSCKNVDTYGLSTMQSRPRTCFYYWRCGQTDAWYHRRPGDSDFHDFRANAAALLNWNASNHIRIRA
mmetsp:Transcript_39621/g.84382  ORF Transcript_39621/g.84382 Transcript_39621/m.84382 type:complete len:267 (+) Transcript_39621:87-887(+)